MTFKQFKADPKKAMAELGDIIYCVKPYVITNDRVIMSAGDVDHFTSGVIFASDYYDDCEFKLREYDLHANDNTKATFTRVLSLTETGALIASCICGFNHLYLLRGKNLIIQG